MCTFYRNKNMFKPNVKEAKAKLKSASHSPSSPYVMRYLIRAICNTWYNRHFVLNVREQRVFFSKCLPGLIGTSLLRLFLFSLSVLASLICFHSRRVFSFFLYRVFVLWSLGFFAQVFSFAVLPASFISIFYPYHLLDSSRHFLCHSYSLYFISPFLSFAWSYFMFLSLSHTLFVL